VQAGLILNTMAIVVLRFTSAWLLPGLALYGIGLGLVLSQINNLTLSAVPVDDAGEASGVANTFRQIGIALGTAIIGAVMISTILARLEAAVPPQSKPAIMKMMTANAAELAFGEHGVIETLPPPMRALRAPATEEGIKRAFLLGLAASTFLPLRPRQSGAR